MHRLIFLLLLLLTSSCSGNDGSCAELPETCSPLYEPTFSNVFERTLKPTCGVGGVACHSREGAQSGLVFETLEQSYDTLIRLMYVEPGDASCSLLTRRIEGAGVGQMPPGRQLSDAERCSIATWIKNGASL